MSPMGHLINRRHFEQARHAELSAAVKCSFIYIRLRGRGRANLIKRCGCGYFYISRVLHPLILYIAVVEKLFESFPRAFLISHFCPRSHNYLSGIFSRLYSRSVYVITFYLISVESSLQRKTIGRKGRASN